MKQIAIVGAGKIGAVIADMLVDTGDYAVKVIDASADQLARLDTLRPVETVAADVSDGTAMDKALHGAFAVLSAAPYHVTTYVAHAAARKSVHYLDLTEDVASTRIVKKLAAEAPFSAFIPQCGLAPGFISIVAHDLASRFDTLEEVRMRVGALPQHPSNSLKYNLTWSTDGVINEYCEPCEAIIEGRLCETPALEGLEEFAIDGVQYEAFNTSGGLGTLCETLQGKVRTLNYRTIRYPGHAALMKTLLQDLDLRNRRALFKDVLEHALPTTLQDVVVIFVTVTGRRGGRLEQVTYAHKVYAGEVCGKQRSAIQITTAAGICTVLDLLASGTLPQQGFVRQEEISLAQFLVNRFGKNYRGEADRIVQAAAAA